MTTKVLVNENIKFLLETVVEYEEPFGCCRRHRLVVISAVKDCFEHVEQVGGGQSAHAHRSKQTHAFGVARDASKEIGMYVVACQVRVQQVGSKHLAHWAVCARWVRALGIVGCQDALERPFPHNLAAGGVEWVEGRQNRLAAQHIEHLTRHVLEHAAHDFVFARHKA